MNNTINIESNTKAQDPKNEWKPIGDLAAKVVADAVKKMEVTS